MKQKSIEMLTKIKNVSGLNELVEKLTKRYGDVTAVNELICMAKPKFKDISVLIKDIKVEGKKKMSVGDYLRGHTIAEGTLLGKD